MSLSFVIHMCTSTSNSKWWLCFVILVYVHDENKLKLKHRKLNMCSLSLEGPRRDNLASVIPSLTAELADCFNGKNLIQTQLNNKNIDILTYVMWSQSLILTTKTVKNGCLGFSEHNIFRNHLTFVLFCGRNQILNTLYNKPLLLQ